ncbi:MAG: FMN-binding protein [Clostridia bacterium]|nr:FMN-binding protein [Clostridia bacterium]
MSVVKTIVTITLTAAVSFGLLYFGEAVEESLGGGETSPLNAVMPGASEFTPISADGLDETVAEVYAADTGGYVFSLDATGYYPHMMILCGIDEGGVITGAICTESSESLGREMTYGEQFAGHSLDTVESVEVITGATKTTKGYKRAVKTALETFEVLTGGR